MFVGGIEGGGTHSKLIIYNADSKPVAAVDGPSTNHWMVGIPECAKRIAEMVASAKRQAKIPESTKLAALGLSLSGCEQDATNRMLEEELRQKHPSTSESYVICSDTVGSICTATNLGGIVLIAGTGSNGLLRNPNGKTVQCGGWGHILGDEGGAWWISHRAMKTVFDHEDNFKRSDYNIDKTWAAIKTYFQVETRADLLDHCYAKFSKAFFAGLCKQLAMVANTRDELCVKLFIDAGSALAQHVLALLPKVEPELVKSDSLNVVCVGSVWDSWLLLKPGFVKTLNTVKISHEIKLLRLTKSMAHGAVYLAADSIKFNLDRNYKDNVENFFTYSPAMTNNDGHSGSLTNNHK